MEHAGFRPAETTDERAVRLRRVAWSAAAIVAAVAVGRTFTGLGLPEWIGWVYPWFLIGGLIGLWEFLVDPNFGCRQCGTLVGTARTGLPAACPRCSHGEYTTHSMGVRIFGFSTRQAGPPSTAPAPSPQPSSLASPVLREKYGLLPVEENDRELERRRTRAVGSSAKSIDGAEGGTVAAHQSDDPAAAAGRLRRLQQLRSQDLITHEEYSRKRQEILEEI